MHVGQVALMRCKKRDKTWQSVSVFSAAFLTPFFFKDCGWKIDAYMDGWILVSIYLSAFFRRPVF